jgi:hypothetical protein
MGLGDTDLQSRMQREQTRKEALELRLGEAQERVDARGDPGDRKLVEILTRSLDELRPKVERLEAEYEVMVRGRMARARLAAVRAAEERPTETSQRRR